MPRSRPRSRTTSAAARAMRPFAARFGGPRAELAGRSQRRCLREGLPAGAVGTPPPAQGRPGQGTGRAALRRGPRRPRLPRNIPRGDPGPPRRAARETARRQDALQRAQPAPASSPSMRREAAVAAEGVALVLTAKDVPGAQRLRPLRAPAARDRRRAGPLSRRRARRRARREPGGGRGGPRSSIGVEYEDLRAILDPRGQPRAPAPRSSIRRTGATSSARDPRAQGRSRRRPSRPADGRGRGRVRYSGGGARLPRARSPAWRYPAPTAA